MAVIKLFDSKGVKTLVIMGNAMEQDYDAPDEKEPAPEDLEAEE